MSDEGFKYQASYKFGPGQAHMLNVRADSPGELGLALMEAEKAAGALQGVATALSGAPNVTTHQADPMPAAVAAVQQQIPQAQAAPAAAPPAPAASAAPAPTCIHGARQFRSSKPGAAKAWSAWMCPTPKGTAGQCEPEWVR